MEGITYETKKDIEEQEYVRTLLQMVWGWQLVPLHKYHHFDFVALGKDNEVLGYVEFKRRKGNHDQYDDIFLSANKREGLVTIRKPVRFVTRWDDAIIWTRLTLDMFDKTYWFSRNSRETPEEVAKIPIDNFERLDVE